MSKNKVGYEYWNQRYIAALLDAIGAAYIMQLHEEYKLLHSLSCKAMHYDSKRVQKRIDKNTKK